MSLGDARHVEARPRFRLRSGPNGTDRICAAGCRLRDDDASENVTADGSEAGDGDGNGNENENANGNDDGNGDVKGSKTRARRSVVAADEWNRRGSIDERSAKGGDETEIGCTVGQLTAVRTPRREDRSARSTSAAFDALDARDSLSWCAAIVERGSRASTNRQVHVENARTSSRHPLAGRLRRATESTAPQAAMSEGGVAGCDEQRPVADRSRRRQHLDRLQSVLRHFQHPRRCRPPCQPTLFAPPQPMDG